MTTRKVINKDRDHRFGFEHNGPCFYLFVLHFIFQKKTSLGQNPFPIIQLTKEVGGVHYHLGPLLIRGVALSVNQNNCPEFLWAKAIVPT